MCLWKWSLRPSKVKLLEIQTKEVNPSFEAKTREQQQGGRYSRAWTGARVGPRPRPRPSCRVALLLGPVVSVW